MEREVEKRERERNIEIENVNIKKKKINRKVNTWQDTSWTAYKNWRVFKRLNIKKNSHAAAERIVTCKAREQLSE